MAETDFVPIYAGEQSFRPAYNSRQGNAGFRAPGFIGFGTSSAQPQSAPVQGAQTSADATAALRGLYPARADESGIGIGERSGGINAGQQPTREADSLVDLGVSIAKGLGMMSGVTGLAGGLYSASQRDNTRGYTSKDLFGEGLIGRALASVFGSGAPTAATGTEPGFDPTTGTAPGERSLGIDRSVTSEPLAPPSGAGEVGSFGGGQFDPVTGMSAGERDLGIDRSVTSEGIGDTVGGPQASGGSNAPSGSDGRGFEWRNGGPVGKPGSTPMPVRGTVHTGEFVQRPEAVNKYGPSAMAAINALKADPAGIKKATKSPPSKGKMLRKDGPARDALASLKAKR